MAITSGVRAPRAQITIGGQSFNVLSASVNQEATRRSSTMSASCALNTFPGGDGFFAGLSDNSGSIAIDGIPLVTGEWDNASIGYGDTLVALTGRDSSTLATLIGGAIQPSARSERRPSGECRFKTGLCVVTRHASIATSSRP
jgi:hypothetical protein